MKKIYNKATKSVNAKKNKSEKYTRKRDVVANFRVSAIEKRLIDARIGVTGLSRSEFFIQSCLYQKILVKGNIKSFDNINRKMAEIAEVVNTVPNLSKVDAELVESWRVILEILDKLYGGGDENE